MQLDDRIKEGARVLVSRRFEAEVVSVAVDRLTCQVRPVSWVAPPPLDSGDDADTEVTPTTGSPPLIVSWHEVKLVDAHL